MIYVLLNWWQSLNEEAAAPSTDESYIYLLNNVFTIWRAVTSIIAGIGVAIQIPYLTCVMLSPSDLFPLLYLMAQSTLPCRIHT